MPFPPEDIDTPNATCMFCFKTCTTWELIYTGDEDTYEGWEIWAYCPECPCETFHPCKQIKPTER